MAAVKYEPCPKCRALGKDRAGDNLVIWPNGGGWCFSCGYSIRASFNPNRINAVNETIREQDQRVLPNDFTRDVPAHAWKWLLQYGLSLRYWLPYVGWSEKDSRLIFTVGSPAEFSLGRFIPKSDGETNKRKWFAYGDCHRTPHIFGDYFQAKEIVLVEDLISAHKVGTVSCAIPLFGTKVFETVYPLLRRSKLPVVIWLDKDQQDTLSKKAYNLSTLISSPVSYIITELDPKALSTDTIKELLK